MTATLLGALCIVAIAILVGCVLSSRWFDAYMRDMDARDKQVERETARLLDKANAECVARQRLN
jgi:hypothetical protein